ncbi:hypothetical protein INT43_006846 [Umbelopsis isabellina]|uniref:Uncharacterized protein n=1 Tax=Mortierella isabellina TaxID=91625 RepID=A0A8H7PZC9_MORIS|nr:hypothetical protein INT43_006846 [Umbelopsis isabellina]
MALSGEPHVLSEKLTEPDDSHLLSLENDNLYVKHNDRFVPCDQEPIHIPGATQHHGTLIGLNISTLRVEYMSENTPKFFGVPHIKPDHLFELKSFKKLLSDYQRDRIYKYIDSLRDASKVGPSSFVLEVDVSVFYRVKRYNDLLQEHYQTGLPSASSEESTDHGYYSERTENTSIDGSTSRSLPSTITDESPRLSELWQDYSDDEDSDREDSNNPYKKRFYCSMHRSQKNPGLLILELEAFNRLSEVAYDKFFFGLNTLVHTFEHAKNIEDLCGLAVRYVQHVTAYERVMMYQFDDEWNGVVIAETLATDSDAESYMGIHFPSSDIPKQARDLYLSNKSRYLCDRSAPTSRLLQANRSRHPSQAPAARPLDMTYCHLRAMSPVHLIYLGHMGVESSMSIAVTVYGKLWGLICCHHMFALPVTFQARTACAYLGTLISTHLENMINTQRFDQCHQVRTLAEQYWSGYNVTQKDKTEALLSSTHRLSEVAKASAASNVIPNEKAEDSSPEDEYCSSCDERDYFDESVAERLEGLDIDVGADTYRGQRKQSDKSTSGPHPKKFRRRRDHDSRSVQDWSRMYERFVRAAGPTVCNLFGADYMLFMIQGRSIAIPSPALMPDPEAVSRFAQYLQTVRLKKTVVSNNISKDFHGMESTRGLSGAIYLPLSDDGSDFAIFCRQEQVVNVTWAGEPVMKTQLAGVQSYSGDIHQTLLPRKSFQRWTQTIQGSSASWTTHVNPELLLTTLSVFQESLKTWKNRMLRIDGREARYRNNQLEQAKRLAEESDKKKSLLLANVSHEVRTPLHGISGVIDLLLDTELSADQTQMLKEADQATKTLTTIINDLLDFSKLERGQIRIQKSAFNLVEAIIEVCGAFDVRFKEKGIAFTVDIDPSLPQWTVGDCDRLKQVFRNFVSNAFKYTFRGRVTASATLVNVEDDGKVIVKIAVKDTGIGIPLDRQELIFEKFVQGDDSLSNSNTGIGLGLAVSHTLAKVMGGEVGLQSTPNVGSEFFIKLPLEPVDEHSGARPSISPSSVSGSSVEKVRKRPPLSDRHLSLSPPKIHLRPEIKHELLGNFSSPTEAISPYPVMETAQISQVLSALDTPNSTFRVLCVEDNKLNQALICRMMQKLHYTYDVADNGQEAIDIYTQANIKSGDSQRDAFDVILMDLQMPVCDGFEATRQILNFQKQTLNTSIVPAPIIAVTAQAMNGDREICLSKGMRGYVSKPIDFQVMRQLLEGLRCQKLLREQDPYTS